MLTYKKLYEIINEMSEGRFKDLKHQLIGDFEKKNNTICRKIFYKWKYLFNRWMECK